jgi:hypothetical protein
MMSEAVKHSRGVIILNLSPRLWKKRQDVRQRAPAPHAAAIFGLKWIGRVPTHEF